MLFSRNFFTAFLAVAAAGVNGSPSRRDDANSVYVCKGVRWGVECDHLPVNLGRCTDLIGQYDNYNDRIRSFGPPPGVTCVAYRNRCGDSGDWIQLWNPGNAHLEGVNFHDTISAYKCDGSPGN